MTVITTFTEYQTAAVGYPEPAIYPRIHRQQSSSVGVAYNVQLPYEEQLPVYPALAALGEAGELAAKITEERDTLPREAFLKEIGDVLWYVTAAAVDLGLVLTDLTEDRDVIVVWTHYVNSCDRRAVEHHVCRLVATLGRFGERVKKSWRDGTPIAAARAYCLGDLRCALAQLHQIATCFYSDLAEVANLNIEKCRSRRARGVVGGSGDDR